MKLREIVSCWASQELPCNTDLASVRESLVDIGFEVSRIGKDGQIRLKRGTPFGGFDFESEGLEVQVILEPEKGGRAPKMHVGNWGFPFEPFLMKRRFENLSERFAGDINRHQGVVAKENELEDVRTDMKNARRAAMKTALISAMVAAGAVVGVVMVW